MQSRIRVAAALFALAAACQGERAPSADNQAKQTAPSRDPNQEAPPPQSSSERQPVAGSEILYRTDDGHENAITDPVVLTALQQKLARDGLYRGAVDGLASPALADAVGRYRERNDLGEGAVIDHTTSNRLGLDWSQVSAGQTVKKDLESAAKKVEDVARDVGQDLKKKK